MPSVDNFRGGSGDSCTLLGMDLDIAGYSLRRKLGSGSAGAVWQVRDLASGRNAVLKRIPITAIPDQEKLREDLTILQRIRHPHIARLLEFRETGTDWLVITQYVVAGSLTALRARRGPLSPGELVTLLTPLAEALDHLHRSGLTHGSLTPTNTLFDADGRPVLTDAALHPSRPADDLRALATLSHQAGGDPAIFTPDLFTTHNLPSRLLTLAAPEPIDLAFPDDPTTTPATLPDTVTSPPRPPATSKPPTTDDPLQRSRTPLAPAPTRTACPSNPRRHSARPARPRQTPLQPPQPPPNPPPPQTHPPCPHLTPHQPPNPPNPTRARTRPHLEPAARLDPARRPEFGAHSSPRARHDTHTRLEYADQARPPRTRRHRWRRSHTRLARLVRRRTTSSARRRLPHPAYGVLAAAALGAVIVLVIGIATIGALNSTPTAATNQPTTPPTPPQPASSPRTGQPTTPRTAPPSPTRSPTTTASRTDAAQWTLTLQALDAQRAHAFWTLDPDVLDKIYVPGSPPWLADRALLDTYLKQNVRIQGLRIQIDSTTVTHQTPTTITLKTTDHLSAGQAIDQTGTTTPLPPGSPMTRLITAHADPNKPDPNPHLANSHDHLSLKRPPHRPLSACTCQRSSSPNSARDGAPLQRVLSVVGRFLTALWSRLRMDPQQRESLPAEPHAVTRSSITLPKATAMKVVHSAVSVVDSRQALWMTRTPSKQGLAGLRTVGARV